MPVKLPKANTAFQLQTDSSLAAYAQNVHDGLLSAIATYPTPPVLPAALQILIDTYSVALAASIDGSRYDTAVKKEAKLALVNALRVDCTYVNQLTYNLVSGGLPYADAQVLILSTGYVLSVDPGPIGLLPAPILIKHSSPSPGQLYILLEKLFGARSYELSWRIVATPEVVYSVSGFPSSRIRLDGIPSGSTVEFFLAGIGASPIKSFTTIFTQVII